jgi:hypothetical protein
MDHEQERPGARSVAVGGDLTSSTVVTGDNATVIENAIILPATPQDQGPIPQQSRAELLDRLTASSRAQMIARWRAAGIPTDLAVELADDPTVGVLPAELSDFPPGTVKVLEGHLGMGKSLLGERLHQQDIQRARLRVDAPVPVWLPARSLRESLEMRVVALSLDPPKPTYEMTR